MKPFELSRRACRDLVSLLERLLQLGLIQKNFLDRQMQQPLAIEHLKCGWCDWETEFLILFYFNNLHLNTYAWLVATALVLTPELLGGE